MKILIISLLIASFVGCKTSEGTSVPLDPWGRPYVYKRLPPEETVVALISGAAGWSAYETEDGKIHIMVNITGIPDEKIIQEIKSNPYDINNWDRKEPTKKLR